VKTSFQASDSSVAARPAFADTAGRSRPRGSFGDASGGRALFIGNGELRFPIHRWLRGVGFVDLGNVYPTAGDITLSNLQVGQARAFDSTRR
jgi:outer membrane protein assembly factor BamA